MSRLPEPKDNIDLYRFSRSKPGELIHTYIEAGLLSNEDLNNQDVIDFINNSELWTLTGLSVGDEVFIVDDINPRQMVRAKVVYAGSFVTLAYNDKTLVKTPGVSLKAKYSFPRNLLQRGIQTVLPMHIDIIDLASTQKIFRVINEEVVENNEPRFILEA